MSKHHSTTPDGFKRCSSGDTCVHPMGCVLPATLEYFGQRKDRKSGFVSKCRACTAALERQKRRESDHVLEIERRRNHPHDYDGWLKTHFEKLDYEARGLKRCSSGANCKHSNGPLLPRNHDYFGRTTQGKGIRSTCKMCDRYTQRVDQLGDRLDEHLAKVSEIERLKNAGLKRCSAGGQCIHPNGPDLPSTTEYFKQRHGRDNQLSSRCILCTRKQGNEGAKQRGHSANKRYNAKYPERLATQRAIRRARMKRLPNTLTPEQWQRCLEYWENRCAYCSQKPFTMHIEHYIAVANVNCPGTVALNIIPACDRCNTSKRDVIPIAWLSVNFPPNEVTAIMERIEAYFEWVRTIDP